ncbi:MAG: glycosyltransferase involved in cell wall biosynthesis [Planctomycetota bacterium]|jgi:glycosyltransferase involved in cell wall biosynthesis
MRILHVMECTIGGTRRHLVDLARGQAAVGHEVHVIAAGLRDTGMLEDFARLKSEGVGVHRLDMVRSIRPLLDWKHYRILKGYLETLQPEIVHSHSSKAGALARKASMATGVGKRVHTPHTMAFLFSALFHPAKRRIFRAIETNLGACTDRMIAVSASEGDTLRGAGVIAAERIRVVANGIDPTGWDAASPLNLVDFGLDGSKPTLALVGLVYGAKGQDLAIEALGDPALNAWQLLCVGPGDCTEYEALARKLGVHDRVRFVGARSDIPEVLASVKGLILPSRWEGMPYVVLEAMAAGKPVLAHPVDGARDVVQDGETGILCGSTSVAGLVEGWKRFDAAGETERQRWGSQGQESVRARYSHESMVAGTLQVYSELL